MRCFDGEKMKAELNKWDTNMICDYFIYDLDLFKEIIKHESEFIN